MAIHDEISRRWRHGDRIVYLGNYLGRGAKVREVFDELLIPEDIVYLRGAQEEIWRSLLQLQLAPQPTEVLDWMVANDVGHSLAAYDETPDEVRKYVREGILATTKWTNRLREKMRSYPGHNDIFIALRRAAYTEDGELLSGHRAK